MLVGAEILGETLGIDLLVAFQFRDNLGQPEILLGFGVCHTSPFIKICALDRIYTERITPCYPSCRKFGKKGIYIVNLPYSHEGT